MGEGEAGDVVATPEEPAVFSLGAGSVVIPDVAQLTMILEALRDWRDYAQALESSIRRAQPPRND